MSRRAILLISSPSAVSAITLNRARADPASGTRVSSDPPGSGAHPEGIVTGDKGSFDTRLAQFVMEPCALRPVAARGAPDRLRDLPGHVAFFVLHTVN